MNDQHKTKAQLIEELEQTRKRVAELEQVEEALRESEDKYRTIFENVHDSITYIDKYGTIIDANDKEEIFGRKPEEIIGKRFTELGYFDVKDIPKYLKLLKNIITGKKHPMQMELEVKHKDGHKFPVEISTSLVKKDGKTEGFVCMVRDITERKQAEEALRASEEKFRHLFKYVPVGIFQSSPTGRLFTANPALINMLGYGSEEDMMSIDIARDLYMNPEDRGKSIRELESVGELKNIELTLKRKDGTPITVLENAYAIRDADGKVKYYEGMLADITERKQVEDALRESEEKHRSVIERANDGIGIIQDDMVIKYVNDSMAKMIGYEAGELIGKRFLQFIPAEDIEELTDRYKQRLTGKSIPSIYEISLMKKNGERIKVEINAGIIQHEGKVADLAFIRDITERKQMEEALEESEQRYREIVEDASDVVYTTDPDGYFTYVNLPAEKLTGYSKDVLIGMHFTEIVSPEWRDRVQSFYLQQRDNLVRNSSLDFPILTRTGEEKWIEQKVTMLIERDQLTGVQSIVRDITERKRAEEALREMATIDPLTSLYNRRRFSEFLAHEIDRTKRYKTDMSIIMFDIDHFKKINDTYGHEEGDNVLHLFGARMKEIIRESDIIARWGGEEFMILAVNADLKNAQIIAEKIRADIENQQLASAPKFTISAGVTQFGDNDDAASLINRADKALYKAKDHGRNQVQAA